jgi:hypothetical protein
MVVVVGAWGGVAFVDALLTDKSWPVRSSIGSLLGRGRHLSAFVAGLLVAWTATVVVGSALAAVGVPPVPAFNVAFGLLTLGGVAAVVWVILTRMKPPDSR